MEFTNIVEFKEWMKASLICLINVDYGGLRKHDTMEWKSYYIPLKIEKNVKKHKNLIKIYFYDLITIHKIINNNMHNSIAFFNT